MINTLAGRKVYIPRMGLASARTFAAAFRSIGVDAEPVPESDSRSLELGSLYTSGDECYPEKVTLGAFLRVTEQQNFDPKRTAFLMATASGPCRFGQYAIYTKMIMDQLGYDDVFVLSPTSDNGYDGLGECKREFTQTGWRALVGADILRKMLHKTRPYELHKGESDTVYDESIEELCGIIEQPGMSPKGKLAEMVESMTRARDRFRAVPADYSQDRPLIGVVGEIYCRLDTFCNDSLIRKLEEHGGVGWLSDISEWVWYTNLEQLERIRAKGKTFSLEMLGAKIKNRVQEKDEHALYEPFKDDLKGYEEPSIRSVLRNSQPYLPHGGALGEMVLSVGKSVCLYEKGVDGIVDISPFTCMNGITSEAVYPSVSRDHDDIPIRNFYFDGTQSDLDRDVEIFIELAKTYRRRKRR